MVFIAYLSRNNKTFFLQQLALVLIVQSEQLFGELLFVSSSQAEKRADVSMRRKLKRTIVQSEVRKLCPSQEDDIHGKRKTEQ